MDPNIIALLVVIVVVVLFLFREHKKSGKYFGKSSGIDKKQEKQLELFKKLYAPIADPDSFPMISSHGYEFEDVALSAQTVPYDPPIPTPSEIETIKTQDQVKIVLLDREEEAQRVWVEIALPSYPYFDGILLNTPFDIEELSENDKLTIHANHILQIKPNRE